MRKKTNKTTKKWTKDRKWKTKFIYSEDCRVRVRRASTSPREAGAVLAGLGTHILSLCATHNCTTSTERAFSLPIELAFSYPVTRFIKPASALLLEITFL